MHFVILCDVQTTEQYVSLDKFVYGVNERLEHSTKSAVFDGKLRIFNVGKSAFIIVNLNVLFPKFFFIFLLGLVASSLIVGFGWWSLFLGLLSCLGLLWTKYPYFLLFRTGLKKKGFDGSLKLL